MTKKEQKDKMSNSPLISKKTTRGVVSSIMDLKRRKTCNLIFEFFFLSPEHIKKKERKHEQKERKDEEHTQKNKKTRRCEITQET